MTSSALEQYRIADFLEWYEKKQLKLNPDFQRREVWTSSAKVFLIDTILRKLPVPKIYMRTMVDLHTKKSYREVVDGQQRLKAIIDFAADKFALTKHADELSGLKYSTLSPELKETFLSYSLAVDQLINATDSNVIDVFARLNSYTVRLNPAELRHARYFGSFRWAVHNTAKRWAVLWEDLRVVTVRNRLRMADDSLTAEMFGIIMHGVKDGGQTNINKLYEGYGKRDEDFPDEQNVVEKVDTTIKYIVDSFAEVLRGSTVAKAPHFLMVFAAVAHALFRIPEGDLHDNMPVGTNDVLTDLDMARENLATLNYVLESDELDSELMDFRKASERSTHRISSRKVRFPTYYRALVPEPIV